MPQPQQQQLGPALAGLLSGREGGGSFKRERGYIVRNRPSLGARPGPYATNTESLLRPG